MRILKVQVNNYKSLKAVEVEFGDLTILIGKNSSGKSNFVEALYLFFNEFDPALQKDVTGVPEQLWYDKETENPIEFIVSAKLTKTEMGRIFTEDIQRSMNISMGEGRLTVCREVAFKSPNTGTWRTSSVAFNDVVLIEDGKLTQEPVPITPKTALGKPPEKTPPAKTESEILKGIFTNISQMFKGKIKLILAVRNNISEVPKLGERILNIPNEIEKQLVATLDSETLSDTRMWDRIEKDVEAIPSLARLYVREGTLRSKEGIMRFPLSYAGGGDQELLALTLTLRSEKALILAIEEPETHLHPYLSRKFFSILNEVSKRKQLIITTHSPIFVDLANLRNSWIFRRETRETQAYRIERAEDLRTVSYELGIRPSDVFFADKILFVEGPIDKTVYRIWAEKLRIDLKSPIISVIPLRGKNKGKRHLQAWIEVTRNIPVSASMILDKDARAEANKLIKDKLATSRQISVLSKGAIEDYYDASILMAVMKERYGAEFTLDDLKPSQSEGLIKFLKKKHRGWRQYSRAKSKIGEDVATKMTREQIHVDISRALAKTREYLEFL
jgi:predicted ATP-dependent endonuclease of OLD family